MIPRLAFTPGEPAGIGPDLAIRQAQEPRDHQLIAFADPTLLEQRANQLQLPLVLHPIDFAKPSQAPQAGELFFCATPCASPVKPGQLNTDNAPYVLQCLDKAITACINRQCQAMITGPVQKSVINDAGISFSGHTEYLAEHTQTPKVVMLLASENLKVALATTHLPLAQVPAAITQDLLIEVLTILHRDLQQKFAIDQPTILVCGLNPHAGESGHLGREEIDIIAPALATLNHQGIECVGPLPADTLFTPKHLRPADAVLAMYHDQGLPVLKYQGFGQAANITLGLPIIRTSVDHGTALDLAATGKINTGSLDTAIHYALHMATASSSH